MTVLDQLLVFSGLGTMAVIVLNRSAWVDKLSPLLYAITLFLLLKMSALGYGTETVVNASFKLTLFGETLQWRFDAISWFFALITIGSALFAAFFIFNAYINTSCLY